MHLYVASLVCEANLGVRRSALSFYPRTKLHEKMGHHMLGDAFPHELRSGIEGQRRAPYSRTRFTRKLRYHAQIRFLQLHLKPTLQYGSSRTELFYVAADCRNISFSFSNRNYKFHKLIDVILWIFVIRTKKKKRCRCCSSFVAV